MTESWEYRVDIVINLNADQRLRHLLNSRGADGWELVSIAPRANESAALVYGDLYVVFKRPGLGNFDPDLADPPAY